MNRLSFLLYFLALAFLFSCAPKVEIYPFKPAPGSSVVIIGNSFAEGLQRNNYFETLMHTSFKEHKLSVRNLAWDADEVNLRPRPLNFGTIHDHLQMHQADIIFACFGMNESFKGPDSLATFKKELETFLISLQELKNKNHHAPEIILVSPIYHEDLGGELSDPKEHNESLAIYTKEMSILAKSMDLAFINLFEPTKKAMKSAKEPMTTDGIHLTSAGYKFVSEFMAKTLDFPMADWPSSLETEGLRDLVKIKNQHFFYKYKSQNGEYIYGRRKEWAGGQELPSELDKIDHMVEQLDSLVWQASKSATPINQEVISAIIHSGKELEQVKEADPTTDQELALAKSQFILPEDFEIELFASEKDFPLANPVAATFDAKGRLWVATMPSYPNYLPGNPPNDKILILEDTNGDGKADKHTVFADSLYLPLGFELGDGGVYLTQAPDFIFLKDTDGDDVADIKEVLLSGFGTEDSHHTLNTYTWGPDGALYMNMGTFLHTQVETPYGPRRGDYGNVWRYEPRTKKFDQHISYLFANPWGDVFMRDGTQLIADVSTGLNYFAPPLTVAIDYPKKHLEMKDFLTSKAKPKTCGIEIISSRAFPDSMQGNVLFNTFIGFQGIRQHQVVREGSGLVGNETQALLQSTDPNFRPVDLQFGPDGALYVVDWYNPVIQHGEQNFRDEKRDHTKGRIWRISHKKKEKLKVIDLTKLSIDELLDQLKLPEDRSRYRARRMLREYPAKEVLVGVDQWIDQLDPADPLLEQHRLEGLWVYQQFNAVNENLLNQLLKSGKETVRAASTRVLFYWRDRISNALQQLIDQSKDTSERVRLEAIIALSYFKDARAVDALLTTSDLPTDDYINYALNEAFRHMRPVWVNTFIKDKNYLANDDKKANLLLGSVATKRESLYIGFVAEDPSVAKYSEPQLTKDEFEKMGESLAVQKFLAQHKEVLSEVNEKEPQIEKSTVEKDTGNATHRLKTLPGKMAFDLEILTVKAGEQVRLQFDNNDQMPHNIVFATPGSRMKVGAAADAMSVLADAYEKNFIPDIPEVLFATPLVPAGERYLLEFVAPKTKGDYPFICTFPGHWQIMHGLMQVR